MLSLIKKDMIITKYYMKPIVGYFLVLLIFTVFKGNKTDFSNIYYINLTASIFMPLTYDFYYGEKVKDDYIFNSLPVTKKEIVISKYISVIIHTAIYGIITYILFYTTNLFTYAKFSKGLSLYFILDLLMIILFFYSIEIPIYIKFKNRIIRFIIFFSYFMFIDVVKANLKTYLIYRFSLEKSVYFILFFAVISIFLLSILISIKIYENKDID
ncbi:ABC-2 transporter permease [Clostridium oceanicum]|uniref:ABC-2 family transporter protein n=1 Tax=Clostridium oceanicum TaxID=1543 RepID=A0ABP3V2P2_9CLOT